MNMTFQTTKRLSSKSKNLKNICSYKEVQSLLFGVNTENLVDQLGQLHSLIQTSTFNEDSLCLIDSNLFEEIKDIISCSRARIYFGKSLRDIKCVIQDVGFREHDIYINYRGTRKLIVSNVQLPHTNLQDIEYETMGNIITTFSRHVNELAGYFQELELIDQYCTVVEPAHPSFKDDYRKILLDDRVWLHVEVTPEGLATNIHLVGQSEHWQNKLQEGLLSWDHDKNIINNILDVFDISEFPKVTKELGTSTTEADSSAESPTCSICLCAELPDIPGVPQPLCMNDLCGVYYHRSCLYQWLLACAGNRPPAFGVVTGSCPTCLQPIVCNEKDN